MVESENYGRSAQDRRSFMEKGIVCTFRVGSRVMGSFMEYLAT